MSKSTKSISQPANEYVGCPDFNDPEAFAARMTGDMMRPKYRDGDIVIFSPAATARSGDDCYVRFADGDATFKRIFYEAGQRVRLEPRNDHYAPETCPLSRVAGIFRAVYVYRPVNVRGGPK